MPRGEKGVGGRFRVGADGAQNGRNQELRNQQGDIFQLTLLREIGQQRIGGRGGFEADREVDDLPARGFHREIERLEGGGDHADVGAFGLGGVEVAAGGGRHPQQVAERGDNGVRAGRDLNGVVQIGGRRDADRAAGTVQEPDVRRQQGVEGVPHDGVGLPAADFHDPRRAFGNTRDLRCESFDGGGIGIFAQMLH